MIRKGPSRSAVSLLVPTKRFLQSAIALLLLGTVMVVTQTPAVASTNTPENLVGYGSGKCIDDPKDSVADNTPMDIYNCVPGALNEQWRIVPQTDGYFWIQNVLSSKCLTVRNNDLINNEPIIQYRCTNGANEEWYSSPPALGSFVMFAVKGTGVDGKAGCVTVKNKGTANNSALLLYDCVAGDNQEWSQSLYT